jgi:hypothetical protein
MAVATYYEPPARLTVAMLDDPDLLAEAHRIGGSGRQDGYLRAARFLEQAFRERGQHGHGSLSYEQAAAYLDEGERHEQARFVRDLAGIAPRLADAAQQWLHRYSSRAETSSQREARLALAGGAGRSWDEPYAGIDGTLYTPGVCQFWRQAVPAVLVESRVTLELITGFESVDAARHWVRDDRCAMDLRSLAPPPGVWQPRVVQEEHILSALLRRPGELGEVIEWLPATTFTADIRYEIFAAIYINQHATDDSIAAEFGRPGIDLITSQTLRRLAWTPDWDNPRLGGPGTPMATVYLHRLASTDITIGTAARAARRLAAEDATAALASGQRTITHPAPAPVLGRQVLHPQAGRAEVVSPDPARLALPPPSPSCGRGPIPRL